MSKGRESVYAARPQLARVSLAQDHRPIARRRDTLKTRLSKIIIGTAIGAGALGVGVGGSLAVASAATTHTASTTPTSSGTTTAVKAGSVDAATTTSPSATHKATHNCQNMKGGKGTNGKPGMKGGPGLKGGPGIQGPQGMKGRPASPSNVS
jgi:hypothetical protein